MTDVPWHSVVLPRWRADRFDVPADPELLQRLIDDMAAHAGRLAPAACWRLPEASTRGSIEGLLGDWCGSIGQRLFTEQLQGAAGTLEPEVIERAMAYLHAIDHSGLFTGIDQPALAAANWRLFDFGSAIDFVLITALCDWPPDGAQLLEVGGGFGRLPEFFWAAGLRNFRYVNIDAVPASLMYCHEVLRRLRPEREVLLYLGDVESRQRLAAGVDFLIVPAWHAAAALGDRLFDISINIESFQEMNQHLVDHYLALFDSHTRVGGSVFMTNARNYLFKGEYRYPARWQCLFRHHTLRSWSGDHPTEVFRVTPQAATAAGRVREYFYRRELAVAADHPTPRGG